VVLTILGSLKSPKAGVHIINSHYVMPGKVSVKKFEAIYEDYIKYLLSFGKIISIDDAVMLITNNKIPKNDVLFCLTYDDGFEECYTIIAPILEKHGCKATFFINSNYIEADEAYKEEFNSRVHNNDKKAMNWTQIKLLHEKGHMIGSHGLDHKNFSLLSDEEIEKQVNENKNILEKKLGYVCDYFAWTYGKLKDFPENAYQITSKYHLHILSGTNYKKYFSYDGKIINRRHLEPFWKKTHINYFLSVNKLYNK